MYVALEEGVKQHTSIKSHDTQTRHCRPTMTGLCRRLQALRYGTRFQGISQFYLHTMRSSANGMNHTCLFVPNRS